MKDRYLFVTENLGGIIFYWNEVERREYSEIIKKNVLLLTTCNITVVRIK